MKPKLLHLIVLICFSTIYSSAQSLSFSDIERFEDSAVNNFYPDSNRLPGVNLLIAENGKVVYQRASGMADIERGVKMSNETVFEIGSMSKQFAAVALLQLVEKGKIKLSDDIQKYIPWYNSHGEKITIENLLSHTSGIRNFDVFIKPYYVSPIDRSVSEMIHFFMDSSLNFKPGSSWSYSDSGFMLIAYIVELVSEQSYHDYVQQNIFFPLGMVHTCFGTNDQIVMHRARGYTMDNTSKIANSGNIYCWAYGSGDIFSTTSDLLIWINALRDEKIISKEWLNKAWTDYQLSNGESINYGYGWCVNHWNGEKVIAHAGQMSGFVCDYVYLPKQDVFIIALTNTDTKKPDDLIIPIALKYLNQSSLSTTKRQISEIKSYEGVYAAIRKGAEYTSDFGKEKEYYYVRAINEHLMIQRSGRKAFELIPIAKDSFTNKSYTVLYTFKNKGLNIIGYYYYPLQYGPAIYCPKTNLPLPSPMKTTKIDSEALKKYCGKFLLESGSEIVVYQKSNHLILQNGDEIPLNFAGKNVFFNTDNDLIIKFNQDDNEVKSITIKQGQIIKGFRLN